MFIRLQRLYDPSRWDVLVRSFRTAIYTLNTLPSEPLLNLSMYAGLSALKLPACYDEHMKSVDCPVCDPALGQLAKEVPASHHVNSSIVCSITGKIMDEDNMPMALPNGYVYSKEVSGHANSSLSGTFRLEPRGSSACPGPQRSPFYGCIRLALHLRCRLLTRTFRLSKKWPRRTMDRLLAHEPGIPALSPSCGRFSSHDAMCTPSDHILSS